MHDHNLDDLIIDNIEPKNSKLKSFLTIIALLIVILIVAIVLTRVLLKTPQDNDLVFEQETAELIAPELKLQEVTKEPEEKKEPLLPSIVEPQTKPAPAVEKKPQIVKEPTVVIEKEEPKPVVAPKVLETKPEPELSNITQQEIKAPEVSAQQKAKDEADRAYWESVQAKRKAEQAALAKKEKEAREAAKEAEAQKAAEAVAKKPKPQVKPVTKPAVQKPVAAKPLPKQVSTQTYYVQVGAFRKQPSARFLSVIRNNGYRYIMTKPNASGIRRLLIGPFKGKASVDQELLRIKDRIHKRAFVVKR